MTTTTSAPASIVYRHEGPWRLLLNMHPDGPGGVHDDNYARQLGFRRALVPGEAVAEAVMPAIVHRFGARWMEGGWFSMKMVTPTFVDEEVHEVAEAVAGEPDRIAIRLENREGRASLVGAAGIGTTPPWDPALDGTQGAGVAFPALPIGHEYADLPVIFDRTEIAICRDAGKDMTPWFHGPSPWGDAVVPPVVLFAAILHVRYRDPGAANPQTRTLADLFAEAQAARTEALMRGDPGDYGEGEIGLKPFSGMHVQFDVVSYRPMFEERPYVITSHLADKGVSANGRTWFRTVEFRVRDEGGTLYALGRNKSKTFVEGS